MLGGGIKYSRRRREEKKSFDGERSCDTTGTGRNREREINQSWPAAASSWHVTVPG